MIKLVIPTERNIPFHNYNLNEKCSKDSKTCYYKKNRKKDSETTI